ncbi:hypothetical protein J6590_013196 [Homalodisca vitripennis]|nr:hypothetical protein J6590_013196 [Homalodisca vitripennis]
MKCGILLCFLGICTLNTTGEKDRNLNSNYHTDVKVMAATGSEAVSSPKEQEKGNGLLLYLNNYSFYAQKNGWSRSQSFSLCPNCSRSLLFSSNGRAFHSFAPTYVGFFSVDARR